LKRGILVGILVLLAPTAGCATFPFSILHASPMPASVPTQAPRPNASATDGAANLEAAIRDAQALRKSGDLGGAAKALSQLVLIAPDNGLVLGEYGKNLTAQGRSDDALAFLERAIELQPGDWTLYSAQGMAYDQKANYRAAQASYARALVMKPGEPTILNNAALSYMQAGDLDNAEKLLLQVGPGSLDYPRIAQNLALVQSLRAAQSVKTAAAAPPAQEQASSPSILAPAPVATLPSEPDVAHPVVVSEPVISTYIAPPPAPEPFSPVASPSALPAIPRDSGAPGKPAALKSDPVAALAPLRKEEGATFEIRPVPAKAESVAPAKPVEKKFTQPAPKLAPEPKLAAAAQAPTSSPTSASSGATYFVQAGAFFSEERAGVAASALDRLGARVTTGVNDGRAVYRVRIGPFLTILQAKAAVTEAQAMGHADLRIVTQ
jgi:Flp pilus assembly protein TadD